MFFFDFNYTNNNDNETCRITQWIDVNQTSSIALDALSIFSIFIILSVLK